MSTLQWILLECLSSSSTSRLVEEQEVDPCTFAKGTSQAEVSVGLNLGFVGLFSQAQLLHELLGGVRCAGLLREDSSDSKPGSCGV